MRKRRINKLLLISLIAIMLVGSHFIISGAGFIEPGSEDDPIITLSYVEKRIEQLKYYIDQNFETTNNSVAEVNNQLNELKTKVDQLSLGTNTTNASGTDSYAKFQVVFINAGNKIILGESSEVIWRSGKATAIASQNGGLSDVTSGIDLQTGAEIPLNHLLIIPRNDGRGATVTVDSYVMVKGSYTIQ